MGAAALLPQCSPFWGACPRGAQAELFFPPMELEEVREVVMGWGLLEGGEDAAMQHRSGAEPAAPAVCVGATGRDTGDAFFQPWGTAALAEGHGKVSPLRTTH